MGRYTVVLYLGCALALHTMQRTRSAFVYAVRYVPNHHVHNLFSEVVTVNLNGGVL